MCATLSLEEIVQAAIKEEEKSVAAYHFVLEKVIQPAARHLFEEIIQDELGQIEGLRNLTLSHKESEFEKGTEEQKILRFLSGKEIMEIHSLQDALLFSIKKEQAAIEAYGALSRLTEDPRAKKLFEILAEEELSHKRKVEALYNKLVYQEN
ncbi:MAG TPA: ferritin family protein [Candidatus Hypogeohydataceae bacterium YC41]